MEHHNNPSQKLGLTSQNPPTGQAQQSSNITDINQNEMKATAKTSRITLKVIIFTLIFYIFIAMIIGAYIFRGSIKKSFSEIASVSKNKNNNVNSPVVEKSADIADDDFTVSTPKITSSNGTFLTMYGDQSANSKKFRSAAGGFSIDILDNYLYYQSPGDMINQFDKISIINSSSVSDSYSITVVKNIKEDGHSKYSSIDEYGENYKKKNFSSPEFEIGPSTITYIDNNPAYKFTIKAKENPGLLILLTLKNDYIYIFYGRESDSFQKLLASFRFENMESSPTKFWFKLNLGKLYFKLPIGWSISREEGPNGSSPGIFSNTEHLYIQLNKNSSIDTMLTKRSKSYGNPKAIINDKTIDGRNAKFVELLGTGNNSSLNIKYLFIQDSNDVYELSGHSYVFDQIASTFKFKN